MAEGRSTEYRLFTTWRVEAPLADVYQVIRDSGKWPHWWPGVERVLDVEPGDDSGVGRVQRYTWKGLLPYRLSFDLRVTRVDPQVALEGVASGELEGIGRWRFSRRDAITTVRHEWHVHTTRDWMNRVAPVARPVFEWNHEAVMRRGASGLARVLGARLVDTARR